MQQSTPFTLVKQCSGLMPAGVAHPVWLAADSWADHALAALAFSDGNFSAVGVALERQRAVTS
jgi:hypothetical protein